MTLSGRLALATKNEGKVREILEIYADWPIEWITFRDARWPDVPETGETYEENAAAKASAVAGVLRVPAVADDSGIEVDALDGAPGPRSARFAGEDASDEDNLRLLLDRIRGVPEGRRTARYRCVAVCAWPDGRAVSAEAVCEGRIIPAPRGSSGFGYDPAFVAMGGVRTMAELSPDEKNAISHRGKALRALRDRLNEEHGRD